MKQTEKDCGCGPVHRWDCEAKLTDEEATARRRGIGSKLFAGVSEMGAQMGNMRDEIVRLRVERDALASALRAFTEPMDLYALERARFDARAALAKLEGGK